MLDHMLKTPSALSMPEDQAEYQAGLMDGTRYRADGHHELLEKYEKGSKDYRLGFDDAEKHPRSIDPDFAS